MEVHKTQLPGSRLEMKLQLSAQEVDSAYGKVFGELSDQGGIPGFRPGRAPAKIIRRRYDEEMLQEMVWVRILEENYPKLLEQEDIEPIEDPQFPELDTVPLAEGSPLEFVFTLTVRPQPTIKQYKGLKVIKPSAEVTDEDVDRQLKEFCEAAATEVEVERDVVAEGDVVTATLKVLSEGDDEPLSKGEQEFVIGSGSYDPPMDQQMLGKSVGETVSVQHQYPDDYEDDPELAGKQVTIEAAIDRLRERQVPELTDELVKAQTDGEFETVEQLRESVRDSIARQLDQQSRDELENNALAAILAGTEVDLPERLIATAAAESYERFQDDLQREGLSLEAFMDIAQVDEESIQQNERARAAMMLKLNLALDEIRRLEQIEVQEEDMEAQIAEFAESTGNDVAFVRNFLEVQEGVLEQIRERALRGKIVKFIVDSCEVEEIPRDGYEEAKRQEREKLQEQAEAEEAADDEADQEAEAASETEAADADSQAAQPEQAEQAQPAEEIEQTEETDQVKQTQPAEPDQAPADADKPPA